MVIICICITRIVDVSLTLDVRLFISCKRMSEQGMETPVFAYNWVKIVFSNPLVRGYGSLHLLIQ